MEAGHLVGDDIILGVVREELAKPEAAKGVIFDGVVRTIPQAEGLERILAEKGRQMDAVLFFDVSDEEILARLDRRRTSRARADDDPAAVATRLRAYREQTAPVLDWYEARGGCAAFRPSGTVEEIADRVRQALGYMITLKSPREIEIMARAGRIVAGTLALMRRDRAAGHDAPRISTRRRSGSSAATTGRCRPSRASTAFPRPSAPRSTRRSCTGFPRPGACSRREAS